MVLFWGNHYSLYKFLQYKKTSWATRGSANAYDRTLKAKAMILVAPVLAHGIFDGILFSMNVDESLAVICLFLFLYFFNKLRKKGKERIESLMNQ